MDLEQQLRAALAPRRPATGLRATIMERVSGSARRGSRGTGRRGRFYVVGIVLVAAAAATLLLRPRETPGPSTAVAPNPPPAPVADVAPASLPQPTPLARQPMRAEAAPTPAPSIPVKPFTVRVTLLDTTTEPSARTAVTAYQSAFLDRLRVVPGLVLIMADSPGSADKSVDFRLTITGAGPDPDGKFRAGVQAEKLGLGGSVHGNMAGAVSSSIVPACVGPAAADASLIVSDPSPCKDPATIAAFWVSMLRTRMFPADASLRRQLQAQLLDRRLDEQQRLVSMGSIASLEDPDGKVQFDPEFIRGAIELATTATDPAIRAQVWRTLREAHGPDLITPLITASRRDTDGEARLEAVATLGNFASDERARIVLESVATQDPRPLVRAIARRGLAGNDIFRDAAWREYVVTSIKDESRPEAERMEALVYYTFQRTLPGSTANYWNFTSKLLDDGVTRALAQMLPRMSASAEIKPMLNDLARSVASIDHPAITDMLLASLQGDGRIVERATAVQGLLAHGDDPRIRATLQQSSDPGVRAALEQIRTGDREPRLRQMASEMLKSQSTDSRPSP